MRNLTINTQGISRIDNQLHPAIQQVTYQPTNQPTPTTNNHHELLGHSLRCCLGGLPGICCALGDPRSWSRRPSCCRPNCPRWRAASPRTAIIRSSPILRSPCRELRPCRQLRPCCILRPRSSRTIQVVLVPITCPDHSLRTGVGLQLCPERGSGSLRRFRRIRPGWRIRRRILIGTQLDDEDDNYSRTQDRWREMIGWNLDNKINFLFKINFNSFNWLVDFFIGFHISGEIVDWHYHFRCLLLICSSRIQLLELKIIAVILWKDLHHFIWISFPFILFQSR